MKKYRKLVAVLLTFVLTLGVLTGCGSEKKNDTAEQTDAGEKKQTTQLNIAYQPVVGYLPVYLLKDSTQLQDALAEAGYKDIEIKFTEFESGPPENEAFATGSQDIGLMGNVPALVGISAGQKRSIIGIAYNGEKTEAVLVPVDSKIASVQDLKGKKIGLVVGSMAQNFLSNLLEKNGLTIKDVELINLSTGEQQQALATGQVDAIATWEPTITKVVAEGVGSILADGTGVFLAENPIVARSEYVKNNPEIVRIFLQEYKKAAEELNANPGTYASKYESALGLDANLIVEALSNAKEPVDITEADKEDLQGTVDFLYENELITTTFNVKDYIEDKF